MKVFFITIILFYVSVVHSDWKYAVTHHSGVVYWYHEESLVKSGDWRKILIKSRYPESSIMKLKHNVGSAKGLYKINCSEFSYQFMEQYFYFDEKWEKEAEVKKLPSKRKYIPPGSIHEYMGHLVCRNL